MAGETSAATGFAVEGPVEGGAHGRPATAISDVSAPLFEAAGYAEEEFLLGGTATAYAPAGGSALGEDGRWQVEPAATAAYRTRLLVRRPPADRFNGTVYVEWLNVTSGVDLDGSFHIGDEELLAGYAWVGVSAQVVSVDGPPADPPPNPAAVGLRAWDPERYGSLEHPGDAYSFDIYSQAGRAVRGEGGVDVLGGLAPAAVIALGVSQSAYRLVTYVNALAPRDRVYDGYLIHERGGGGAALSEAPLPEIPVPDPVHIRTDLDVPVLQWETESDVEHLGFWRARQAPTDLIRTWEVPGASHADGYWYARFHASRERDYPGFGPTVCDNPFNDGVARHVFVPALRGFAAWVRGTGPALPQSPPIEVDANGVPVRDELGLARGGARTPMVDAPRALVTSVNTPTAARCFLFGSRVPFDTETLARLYPGLGDYAGRFDAAAEAAVGEGWLLPDTAAALAAEARTQE
jgi:hypothetical protein